MRETRTSVSVQGLWSFAMLFLILMAFDQPDLPECTIDQCDEGACLVDTPEGTVFVPRKRGYEEGMKISCPLELIEPT